MLFRDKCVSWVLRILSEEFSDPNLNYFWNKWWDNLRKRSQLFSRTQLTGRDPKERIKELILDEHTHCGCSCSPYSRNERRVPQLVMVQAWLTFDWLVLKPLFYLSAEQPTVSLSWIWEIRCLKGIVHIFRVQFMWWFQNGMLKNPWLRDFWVNPVKCYKKQLKN